MVRAATVTGEIGAWGWRGSAWEDFMGGIEQGLEGKKGESEGVDYWVKSNRQNKIVRV